MLTGYLSNVHGMVKSDIGVVAYLRIEKLSHDGVIRGFVSDLARFDGSSYAGSQPKIKTFSVQDVELGLPGWASEYLVKRLHMTPKNAFRKLFDEENGGFSDSAEVDVFDDDVWFKLTRRKVEKGYALTPMFTFKQFELYVGSGGAWHEPDGPGFSAKPVTENVRLVEVHREGYPMLRGDDRWVGLYDLAKPRRL